MKIRTTVVSSASQLGCQVDSDLPPSPASSLEQKYHCLSVSYKTILQKKIPVLTYMNGSYAQTRFLFVQIDFLLSRE